MKTMVYPFALPVLFNTRHLSAAAGLLSGDFHHIMLSPRIDLQNYFATTLIFLLRLLRLLCARHSPGSKIRCQGACRFVVRDLLISIVRFVTGSTSARSSSHIANVVHFYTGSCLRRG